MFQKHVSPLLVSAGSPRVTIGSDGCRYVIIRAPQERHICVCVCIYIYIYICMNICVHIYIYIYMITYLICVYV